MIEFPFPRVRLRWIVVALVLYIASYVVLSWNGRYVITMSGQRRWNLTGLAQYDVAIWVPAGVKWEIYTSYDGDRVLRSSNLHGYLYLPLVWIDRAWFHPLIDRWKGVEGIPPLR